MTDNGRELINVIRESEDPEQALITATAIILAFLKQLESNSKPIVACLRELG